VAEDGMVVVRGRLDPEAGAVFMRAIEAASDALFKSQGKEADEDAGSDSGTSMAHPCCGGSESKGRDSGKGTASDEGTPEQRRADAVGLLAERALAAGFGQRTDSGLDRAGEDENSPHADPAPISGSRAERYQVMLHVDADTLDEDAEPGLSELEDGTRVSAEPSGRRGESEAVHGVDPRDR
jgi:hypothetical protein